MNTINVAEIPGFEVTNQPFIGATTTFIAQHNFFLSYYTDIRVWGWASFDQIQYPDNIVAIWKLKSMKQPQTTQNETL